MLLIECKSRKDMLDLLESEFVSFRNQFSSLPNDFDMGLVPDSEMIRYYGILNRLTNVHNIAEDYKPITDYVTNIVDNYDESVVDDVIKSFSPATIINTLAYAEAAPSEYIDQTKHLLACLDTFDTTVELKINIVKKSDEALKSIIPEWFRTQLRSHQACTNMLFSHLELFKHIYPHIAMMSSLTDHDSESSPLSIYSKLCGKIYAEITSTEEPKSDIDAQIKKMILL